MTRSSTRFFCRECGYNTSRWLGKCPNCGSWNSLEEETVALQSGKRPTTNIDSVVVLPITEVPPVDSTRFSSGVGELDRVLGGGIVPGSLVLVGGDPGIGKSTLLLQVSYNVSLGSGKVYYVSGEESLLQIRLRGERLGVLSDSLYLACCNYINEIEQTALRLKPAFIVIDSIQAVYDSNITSAPGSIVQVRDCTARLMRLAKSSGITIFIIGHVTKEGLVAGPRVLEHMVDVVLYLEGERHQQFRLLRGVKNRFGSTNEFGVFEMQAMGMVEVDNPSSLFISENSKDPACGSVVTCNLEGTRPLLVEIQALVCSTAYGMPRRMTAGLDYNRVALIMAVLDKRIGLNMSSYDAYVNAVGGAKLTEPGVDLAIALALSSSFRDKKIQPKTVAVGEIGLTGEIRAVPSLGKRILEASKLGFTRFICPSTGFNNCNDVNLANFFKKIDIVTVDTLTQALSVGF